MGWRALVEVKWSYQYFRPLGQVYAHKPIVLWVLEHRAAYYHGYIANRLHYCASFNIALSKKIERTRTYGRRMKVPQVVTRIFLRKPFPS